MTVFKKAMLAAIAALGMAFPAIAAERAIIILDGSGSMWAQVDGKARITIARETLHQVLADLPDDLELGFMSYGHREKGNCDDIEMLVEPATGTGAAIASAADKINPKGKTPISEAVRRAAEDLRFTEEKATVILITDGLETCEVDPCVLASELEQQGVDFTTHVLGFGLSDEEGHQVACLAENTGGKYLSAQNGADLVEALTTTVAQVTQAEVEQAPEPEPEPVAEYNLKPTASLSEGGPDLTRGEFDITWKWYKPAADGTPGEYVGTDYYADFEGTLEPGDYILTAEVGYATVAQPITIEAGKVAAPHFVLNAAVLKLHPKVSADAAADDQASIELKSGDAYLTTVYGDKTTVVPAGLIDATATIGDASVTRSFSPKAGDTVDEDIIVGAGLAAFAAEYAPGSAIDDDIYMEVYKAKTDIAGNREKVAYGFGGKQDFTLAEGDYVMAYELDGTKGEVPFSVKTGERSEVPVVIDAGVVAVTTPTDDYVEFLSASKDIAGNREKFDYAFGPEVQTTLKAGDYIVRVEKGDAVTETPITVKAGERFELTVTPKAEKTKNK